MAHSALSLGMIAVSFLDNVRIDLMSYLFGDLLAISPSDLTFIWFGVVTVSLIVYLLWQPLLSTSVNEELAFVEGTNTDLMRLILMLLIGLVIAVGMKFVGALIMGSLLIIPAATARRLSRTPEAMAFWAIGLGVLSVIGGLALSWHFDTPAGPSVVVSAAVLFVLTQFKRVA
ncbi:zinc transport system permease protein [Vibrio cholerae]|nr:zinc transport system permease protein [Vibrio cholerae]CSC10281.1 zinc transport system permease protein [Vibrio cholerae]